MLDGVSLDQSLTFMASPDEGWGGMPLHAVPTDIAEGRLIELSIEDLPAGEGLKLSTSAVFIPATYAAWRDRPGGGRADQKEFFSPT